MIYIEEFIDEYKLSGSGYPATVKSATDKFMAWQKSFKGAKPDIMSVQKINNGLFVVYKK